MKGNLMDSRDIPSATLVRRNRFMRRLALAAAVFALAGLAFFQSPAVAQPSESRTVLGFTAAQTDEFVASFVAQHGLSVVAVYLASNGFSGAHRAYGAVTVGDVLITARSETVATFTNLVRGNDVRLKDFVGKHSEAEMVASPELATQARSLLSVRSQAQGVLDAARRGESLVYAIEVLGPRPEQLTAISGNATVRAIQASDGKGAGRVKPVALEVAYHDAAVESRDAAGTREAMLRILAEGGTR